MVSLLWIPAYVRWKAISVRFLRFNQVKIFSEEFKRTDKMTFLLEWVGSPCRRRVPAYWSAVARYHSPEVPPSNPVFIDKRISRGGRLHHFIWFQGLWAQKSNSPPIPTNSPPTQNLCTHPSYRKRSSNNGHYSLLLNNKVSIPICIANCREMRSVY